MPGTFSGLVSSDIQNSISMTTTESTAGCSIQCILANDKSLPPNLSVYLDRHWHMQGDCHGCLYLWDIRKVISTTAVASRGGVCPSFSYDTSCALADSWDPPALPCALTDTLVSPFLLLFAPSLFLPHLSQFNHTLTPTYALAHPYLCPSPPLPMP